LFAVGLFAFAICAGQTANVRAGRLDEMSVDRWKKLRETERYQLNIAEKYYRAQRNWKVAAAEYEKYLTLYERSDGAPYAQLMWSICQSNLKNKHTAIKEGFQSVIDYWPESPDAVSAAYYIGLTYKQIGEVRKAKKAYQKVLADYSKHPVTVFAMNELVDISVLEKDLPPASSCGRSSPLNRSGHRGATCATSAKRHHAIWLCTATTSAHLVMV